MIFVNSMSDLFHETVPLEFIQRVFTTMSETSQHTYQIRSLMKAATWKACAGGPPKPIGAPERPQDPSRRARDGHSTITGQ